MVEAEPDAPAMMIEGYGKQQSGDEEDCENKLIIDAEDNQGNQIKNQDHHLRRNYIDQDCPDEEAFLAHKECVAGRAMMFDFEWTLND